MAGVVGVVNRYRPDRREPHRTPPLFQRLRREGPRGCRATLDATQWELALHSGAAEGLRRAPDEAKKARGLGAAQGGVAGGAALEDTSPGRVDRQHGGPHGHSSPDQARASWVCSGAGCGGGPFEWAGVLHQEKTTVRAVNCFTLFR